MAALNSPEIERRALALFEHLADSEANTKLRARMLKNETAEVLARLAALEASAKRAEGAIPTLIPGSADCGDASPPPERVGAFRLIERVGRGGMGDVWSAVRDDGLYEQKVAVKLIQRHALARAGDAFNDERRFLAWLEHPNIARLIDGGVTEDGLPWLAMEFIEGQPIDLACEALPEKARIGLFIKAADAVQFAHSKLVAHADLKPGNIIVDGDGRVKLLDFGIASLIGDGARSPTGSGPLTREFASPQRIAGAGPSVADDIFALGKTFHLMLDASDDAELAAIAAKACHPDEAERYTSVAALIADLDRWRGQLPVTAMPDGWNYRAGKFIDRHRTAVFATGAALILLSATSLIATSNYIRAERARSEAAARLADARGTTQFMLFGLMARLTAQPRSLALRVHVAEVAQHYLDRMAAAPTADASIRLDAARGLWKLAAYQAKAGQPNLRQPEPARANLIKAQALAEQVAGLPSRTLQARIAIDRAMIAINTDNDTKAADALLASVDHLITRYASADAALRGDYLVALSYLRSWQGNYKEEIATSRLAQHLPPLPDPRQAALFHAKVIELEAEGQFYLDDLKASERGYRAFLVLVEEAHARWPGDNFILGLVARGRWNLGVTLEQQKRFDEALPILAKGADDARQAFEFDPLDREAMRSHRIVDQAYAQNLAYLRRLDEALAILRPYEAKAEQAWQVGPKDPSRLRDYAMAVTMVGEAQGVGGDPNGGCQTDARALGLYGRLKQMGRLSGFDADYNIGQVKQRDVKFCSGGAP